MRMLVGIVGLSVVGLAHATDIDRSAGANSVVVEEIVVTAQKRAERLQDVPVPVTALAAESLSDTNQLRIQDYYTQVPGLSLTSGDVNGSPQVIIRGLTTGGQLSPTVGVVVDDLPYGSSQYVGYVAPDIDPGDLARIEVLRGPQGTLYGASSIGGLLKFVTADPSTERMSGRVQAGTVSVQNGDQLGYALRGSVNVPISSTFALRASALLRQDPGYVSDPSLGLDGVNRTDAAGGRLSGLWRPSETFSLKLGALIQHAKTRGSPLVDNEPDLGDLQHRMLRDTGSHETEVQAYSANLNAKLGGIDLTSVTGYSINDLADVRDVKRFAPLSEMLFGVSGTANPNDFKATKVTQELRLSTALGRRIDWLLGLFYTHENTAQDQHIYAVDPQSGARAGTWLDLTAPLKYEEYAVFTDFTFHVTRRFDVQVGGRESRNRQGYALKFVGPFADLLLGAPSPITTPESTSKDSSFTFLVTPRFKLTDEVMVYARLASGYRPGGPNSVPLAEALPQFQPDTTENYEIGVKGDLFNRALSIDASLYYIDWKDIQLHIVSPSGVGYVSNGSRAKSQGVELAAQSRPLQGLAISGWVAWNDAVLTEPFPAASSAFGLSGDRLPYSSRFSGSLSADQDFPISGQVTGYVGAALSYVGSRQGAFASARSASFERQNLSAYTKVDLHAGTRFGSWTASLFANNVADQRGMIEGGLNTGLPSSFIYIQPRTFGLSLVKEF